MQLYLIKKNLFTPVLVFVLFGFHVSLTNAQKKFDYNYKTSNQEVRKINNDAAKMLFQIIAGKVQESALVSATKNLKRAIYLDPDYKGSYTTLLDCIKSLNEQPYSTKKGALKEQIDVCSSWLARHPDDQEIRLKRGMLYERNKEIILSNKDYEILRKYLGTVNIKYIAGMSEQEIQNNTNYSLILFIIREKERALKLIIDLNKMYPNNARVNSMYRMMIGETREEYISEKQTRTIYTN